MDAPERFEVAAGGLMLRGESAGEGPSVILLHGLTATRDVVVHRSKGLIRGGLRQVAYDARGHGESDPAPPGAGYSYAELAADLAAVAEAQAAGGPLVAVGNSMGAHTAAAYALAHPDRLAGLVLVGPAYAGAIRAADLERWDRLAAALEAGGVDGFCAEVVRGLDPAWRETVERFTRARMMRHRDLAAQARALREVPRSRPFGSLAELERLEVPALVVASRDEADPHHPYAVAAEYAERLPRARLVSEEPGDPPLAWQGGRLAREIIAFCAELGLCQP